MDNLINLDDSENNINESQEKIEKKKSPIIITHRPLLKENDRLSIELNNPFDSMEYRVTHSQDPFECLEVNKMDSLKNDMPKRKDQNSSVISIASSNEGGGKTQVVRCQSDSSTVSSTEGNMSRFNSVDNIIAKKSNQLLKLSLLNSPNSPLHSSSFINNSSSPMVDSVYLEAKKISEKLKNCDLSFEDLNNISQQLVDTSNLSLNDGDLEQLKISFLDKNPVHIAQATSSSTPSQINEDKKDSVQLKIEDLQEKLNLIKKEEEVEAKVDIKISDAEDSNQKEAHMETLLQNINSMMKGGNKEEARKQLLLLNDMLLPSTDSQNLEAPKSIVRQDTFEIDQATGTRRYSSNGAANDSNTSEFMDQIVKLFGAQSLDVSSLNLSGSNNNVVVIVPKMPSPKNVATPMKQNNPARRSVSYSAQRPSNTRGIENKKLSTPMKHTTNSVSASVSRRSSFTAPRSFTKPLSTTACDQKKTNIGAVRKSLMSSMDRSPNKSKISPPLNKTIAAPQTSARSNLARRSVSLKVPTVTLSHATPKKAPLHSTTPSKNKINPPPSQGIRTPIPCRRLSTAPPARPQTTAAAQANKAPVNFKRPGTTVSSQKTEFRTPYGTVTKPSHAKGSLV